MKICFKCDKLKPLIDFHKHKLMKDGHLNKCKKCCVKDWKKNYHKNILHYRAYRRSVSMLPINVEARKKYERTEKGKKNRSLLRKKYRKKYHEKCKARDLLGSAIRYGRIKIQPCRVCGSINRIHAHHEDYLKPLDVVWLCQKHHYERHRQK